MQDASCFSCRRFAAARLAACVIIALVALQITASAALAAPDRHRHPRHRSLAEDSFELPTWSEVRGVFSSRRMLIVASGAMLLGVAAGVVGAFMLLRKRSLVGDVVGHATLPGVVLAYLVLELHNSGGGRSLPALMAGAAAAATAGVICTLAIRRYSRIKEDAAMAIVLSIFFGAGAALMPVIPKVSQGNPAGLDDFIFGMAALMSEGDVLLISAGAAVVLLVALLLFKELALICFDDGYAAARGWPVGMLDLALMVLVVGVTVVGLQAAGLLLVVAMLIIPPAAARFWTESLGLMTLLAAAFGGLTGFVGVLPSALIKSFPAGPTIVLTSAAIFVFSMLLGARRGLLRRLIIHLRLKHRIGRHDLLRAMYECLESANPEAEPAAEGVAFDKLLAARSWPPARLRRLLASARRAGLVAAGPEGGFRLTSEGAKQAARVVRNHRLWELYLIQYADIAPSHVDRDADHIEHVLEPQVVRELDALLRNDYPQLSMPPSPHE